MACNLLTVVISAIRIAVPFTMMGEIKGFAIQKMGIYFDRAIHISCGNLWSHGINDLQTGTTGEWILNKWWTTANIWEKLNDGKKGRPWIFLF